MSSSGRFVWYELRTNDSKSAEAFYSQVIGWNVQDIGSPDKPYTILMAGTNGVAGLSSCPEHMAEISGPAWIGYIAVDNVDEMAVRVANAGGTISGTPEDIPGVGRFALAADPGGAQFILFTPSPDMGEREKPDPSTPGLAGWHELYAADRQEAVTFYETLFGWTKDSEFDMGSMGIYHIFAIDGVRAGGIMTGEGSGVRPTWNYYFNAVSASAAADRVKSAGGTVCMEPHQVPGGQWIVQAKDPQGASFAIVALER